MDSADINSFTGDYSFLGNGYPSPVMVGEQEARTVEHGFQALKAEKESERLWVLAAAKPFGKDGAKYRGRYVVLRDDWEWRCEPWPGVVKECVMLFLLQQKFAIPALAARLLETGEHHLEEGNKHGDRYWGTVDGEGANRLGVLLMHVRGVLRIVYNYRND